MMIAVDMMRSYRHKYLRFDKLWYLDSGLMRVWKFNISIGFTLHVFE